MPPMLWTAAGILLIALEIILPGMFLIWFGGAALLTGLFAWFLGDWGLIDELGLFTVLAGCSIGIAMALARWRGPEAPNDINDRAGQLVGVQATLSEPIVGGHGRIFIGDTLWQVVGPNLPAGTVARVTGRRGMVLTIEAVSEVPQPTGATQ